VAQRKAQGYRPAEELARDAELREAIEMIAGGAFSDGDRGAFEPIVRSLVDHDEYLLFADYRSYVDCQQRASDAYADAECWTRMSILNVARMGRFSSDRAIREYCEDIWKVEPALVLPRAQN
jgi:starch phosphorylase